MSEKCEIMQNPQPRVEILQHGRMFRDLVWWYEAHCPECWAVTKVEDREAKDLED